MEVLLLFISVVLSTNDINRLKYYELVQIKHTQLNEVDQSNPIYPTNGELEFNAFNRHYRLWFHKNTQLFHDNFTSYHHNDKHEKIARPAPTNCYYSGKILTTNPDGNILVNTSSKSAFSACHGKGINGWIYAYDELIVIRPQKLLMHNINNNISINDAYIIYKYNDFDRSDYPHNHGTTCGTHSHIDLHNQLNYGRHLLNQFSATTRYVELAAVNDPAIVQRYKNLYGDSTDNWLPELQTATISIINTVQQYYLDTNWGENIGIIHIVLMSIYYISSWDLYGSQYKPRAMLNYISSNGQSIYCESCQPNLFCSSCLGQSTYYQIDPNDYLTKFHRFRLNELGISSSYDNAQLFSYYDFFSTVIGLASLPGMCIAAFSGGIEQMTYDDEYNGNIVAHEMGHNFNMVHDGANNACNGNDYIMAASGSPYGFRPNSFSECSITEINAYFNQYPSLMTCLNNIPSEPSFSVCGNGIIEQGETCDCGHADCKMNDLDKCCNGIICQLYSDAQCSNFDECCNNCKIQSSNEICRHKSDINTCDIETEYCDGISAQCPYDTKHIEGTPCHVINSHYASQNISYGYCYNGECVNIEQQCTVYGINTHESYTLSENCNYNPIWRTSSCNSNLQCGYTYNTQQCITTDQSYINGIPCNTNINNPNTPPQQCIIEGVTPRCIASTQLHTYVYVTSGWSQCSLPCRDENSTQVGQQTRNVYCALQDGTQVQESNCEDSSLYKPTSERSCHDFVCDFCGPLIDAPHICYPNGECDTVVGICICNYGYSGMYCEIEPSLNFLGITSHVYMNLSGITVAERADPCHVIDNVYDIPSNTQTIGLNVSSLSNLQIGSMVGIRWNSTGELSQLSVGMIRVYENGTEYNGDTQWAFYVGEWLANDENQLCQVINSSVYDPCFEEMSCNDFSFIIPENLFTGYYKIFIRFNKEYNIESNVFSIECTNNICNSEGNGQCATYNNSLLIFEAVCKCDDNWYGDRCDQSLCKPWTFTSNECDSDIFCETYEKPKCFDGVCNVINEQLCECDTYSDGMFCEIPNKYCNDIYEIDSCNNEELCVYNGNENACVYSDCFGLSNDYTQCINVMFEYNNSWPIYCQWIGDELNGYCDRINCDISNFPSCNKGAIRRPLFDDNSICFTWYCDCNQMTESNENEYWSKPTKQTLIASINENYSFDTTLNESHVNNIDLFTCFDCNLNCSHSSIPNNECTECIQCNRNKYAGIECNHLYWIGYIKLNLLYQIIMENYDEFVVTFIQDLAYFFSVSNEYLSIYDIKSIDNGGNTLIYFKYLFNPNINDDLVQIIGGDIMMNARAEISLENSPGVTRGFILQNTDFRYRFNWCIPTKEDSICNTHEFHDINVWAIFLYCALFSFILLGVIIVCWKVYKKRKLKKRAKYYQPGMIQPLSPQQSPSKPSKSKKNYGTYSELSAIEGDAADIYLSENDFDRI